MEDDSAEVVSQLAGEIAELAEDLRASAMEMGKVLQEERPMLDRTTDLASENAARVRAANSDVSKTNEDLDKGWCHGFGMIFTALIIFFLVYFVIKIFPKPIAPQIVYRDVYIERPASDAFEGISSSQPPPISGVSVDHYVPDEV